MSPIKMISKYMSAAFSFTLLAGSLLAHPGHGVAQTDGWGALHYLTSLQHLAPVAGLALVVIALVTLLHRSKQREL